MTDRKTALADELAKLAPQQAPKPASRPMPAEQAKPEKFPARISMKVTPDMKRDLELARIDDGVEVTVRLRAMITLWQEDPKLRARIDKQARADAEDLRMSLRK